MAPAFITYISSSIWGKAFSRSVKTCVSSLTQRLDYLEDGLCGFSP